MLNVSVCKDIRCGSLAKVNGYDKFVCSVSKKQPRYMNKCPREKELSYVRDVLGVVPE